MVFLRMAFGNLWIRKGRTVLTILAVVLSSALLTGISILNNSYLKSYEDGVANMLGQTDLGISRYSNTSSGYFTEQDVMNEFNFTSLPGYKAYTPRLDFEITFTPYENNIKQNAFRGRFMGVQNDTDRGFGYSEWVNISTEIANDTQDENYPEVIEDILMLNRSYAVITTWVANVYNITVDDEIMVYASGTPEALAGNVSQYNSSTWNRLYVKGIINDHAEGEIVNFNYQTNESGHYLNSRLIFCNLEYAREMINITNNLSNQLLIGVNLSDLNNAEKALDDQMRQDMSFYFVNIKEDRLSAVRNSVESMMMILTIFTIISLIVAIMLITNTLLMNIQEQKYENSVLRAIGVFKGEVFRLFLYQAFIIASIGSVLGTLGGIGMSPLLKNVFFQKLPQDITFTLRIYYKPVMDTIVTPLIISLVVSGLIGMLPAYISTKLNIIEGLRNLAPEKTLRKWKKLIFPILTITASYFIYKFLQEHQRDLIPSLIGIIPFILLVLAAATIILPLLTKLISWLISWMLGAFRQITEKNLGKGENRKKANITFLMFASSIAFLIMVSNTLVSLKNIQTAAIPRYLGNDVQIYSEGSTFGMGELLATDEEIIKGIVNNATLINSFRTKINGYGTWPNEKPGNEPRINSYIIEPISFSNTIDQITFNAPTNMTTRQLFSQLQEEEFGMFVTRQLADKDHLNLSVGDVVEAHVSDSISFNFTIFGIIDFCAGFSETWEEAQEILPAASRGVYATWISWQTLTGIIDDIYTDLPDLHIGVKFDDHDLDFWDEPLFNATETLELLEPLISNGNITVAERVWDNETNSRLAAASYDLYDFAVDLYNETYLDSFSSLAHVVFENPAVAGTANIASARNSSWTTVQEALQSGVDQCVITSDIAFSYDLAVDDVISIWHENYTYTIGDPLETIVFRKNFTIAAIVEIDGTLEAFNFDAMNPYVPGNNDVAADDTTAVIVPFEDVEFREQILNHTLTYQLWIEVADYYQNHLLIAREIDKLLGDDYVSVDVKWYFTRELSYAPMWIMDINDTVSQDFAIETIKAYLLAYNMPVIAWTNSDALEEQYSDQIEFQQAFFNIVLAFALLIAVLGIVINMLMSISQRTREIGIIRAIGTFKSEVFKVILGEAIIITLTGLIFGILTGTISSLILLRGLPLDTVFRIWLTIDWAMIKLISIIVIIIALVASLLPARKAMKINVVEAVRDLT